MAVLRMDAVDTSLDVGLPDTADLPAPGFRATLAHLSRIELPEDVRDCEVTVMALFRASLILNFLTGGKPEMTFSARAWRSRRTSRSMAARVTWMLTIGAVDLACAMLRGEQDHCATAWVNYVRRPVRSR